MQVQPYLYFDGRCQEAIDFYRKTLNAEVKMLMHFKDCPDPMPVPPNSDDKVMHANVRVGDTDLLMSDGQCSGKASFQGFALSLSPANDAEAARLFTALSDGGAVTMPLGKTFFASSFGMLADRFGVNWMVMVQG